jgi:peptide/nickel transport system substrate-binding protein
VKYTLDLLFSSNFAKSASFYEGEGADKRSLIKSVEAPDARTVVVTLTKPWVGLLSNLVPIPIIPKDSYESQKTHPLGTGPFKFIRYDNTQQVCDLEAYNEYWEGAPKLPAIRVRVISDMNAMQAELQSGRVDIAPMPTSLSPDAVKRLEQDPNLQVKAFQGSNVVLLTLNTASPPLDNVKVRQAIAYAIDRESLIKNLLLGYGKIAHSIIPEESWSYSPGQTYAYDPAAAKRLLAEAGVRFDKPFTNFPAAVSRGGSTRA